MGYPSLQSVLDAARNLTYNRQGNLLRTNGLWHVFIFLRHRRLNNILDSQTFNESYDLAEACFDINGIKLPVTSESRQVYYEPGAIGGKAPINFFRHREGPRQTYLNRLYTGLTGEGQKQPRLFSASQKSLPTIISLASDWIRTLRV